jgi:hypothetical protein
LAGVADVQRYSESLAPAFAAGKHSWILCGIPKSADVAKMIRSLEAEMFRDGGCERIESGGLCVERRDSRLFLLVERKIADHCGRGEAR